MGIRKIFKQGLKSLQASYSIDSHRTPGELRDEFDKNWANAIARKIGDFPFKIKEFEVELLPEKFLQIK
jgi:hypothetical protein